ncbi:hypothetical protein Pta02_50160 [Planobispora takensis]|uniref:Secreted protein n=1 Tax=Planobispora takensis TaxID=1367882 RepID=A0A8J3WVR8_9ACTN|nr:hypothetical protein Pta02_50160 [Planobispora takensis]
MTRSVKRALAASAALLTLPVAGASTPFDSWVSNAEYEATCRPYEAGLSGEWNRHNADHTPAGTGPPKPEAAEVRNIVLCKTIRR